MHLIFNPDVSEYSGFCHLTIKINAAWLIFLKNTILCNFSENKVETNQPTAVIRAYNKYKHFK